MRSTYNSITDVLNPFFFFIDHLTNLSIKVQLEASPLSHGLPLGSKVCYYISSLKEIEQKPVLIGSNSTILQ